MFCTKCGCQVNDDANFCPRCGTKLQQGLIDTSISKKTNNTELDREALKIYLRDVFTLECLKKQYTDTLKEIVNNHNNLKRNNLYQRVKIFENSNDYQWFHLFYNGVRFCIAYSNDSPYSSIETRPVLRGDDWEWREIEPNMKALSDITVWKYTSYPEVANWADYDSRMIRARAKDRFLQVYERFKKNAPVVYQDNLKKLSDYAQKYEGINQEMKGLDELIKKAYEVNIIPTTFRNNFYAIYYLYDFVWSSQESFTTALLQFNLEEIKKKLDIVIKQQQQIIIQQAIIAARNEEIIQQNQAVLDRLCSIESNTALTAQYSKIAANNAEACAWIGLANYIKK